MKRIILKNGEEHRLFSGHPWVFDNEVDRVLGPSGRGVLIPGETVEVESSRKEYVGRAFANPLSKIVARMYSPSKEGVDRGFFKHRIRAALARRVGNYDLDRESARIVFAEADMLPGLIIDRFVGWPMPILGEVLPPKGPVPTFDALREHCGPPSFWLSIQFLSFGMDVRRTDILHALSEVLGTPAGIVERDDASVRALEGLPLLSGLISGSYPEEGILIFENGLPFTTDLLGGQKTGYFLDQRDNRRVAATHAQGGRVLDLCCHTGGFAVHAARSGASSVIAVDVSAHALAAVRRNAEINGVADRVSTREADVFTILKEFDRTRDRFDLVILDPPAFAKSRSALEGAMRGYKEINHRAMRLLNPGGTLITCSCSQILDEARFKAMIAAAAADVYADTGRRLFLLELRYQAPDHPVLIGYGESLYLKCAVCRCSL